MPEHVRIVARTRDWLRYEVPDHFIRRDARGHYRGQKQIWFLLQLTGRDSDMNLRATDHPGVRRLALERVLGAARRRDRVQARRLPDGADRARALPAARRAAQPLPALGAAAAPPRGRRPSAPSPRRTAAESRRARRRSTDADRGRRRRRAADSAPALPKEPLRLTPALAQVEHEVVAVDQLGLAGEAEQAFDLASTACARSAAPRRWRSCRGRGRSPRRSRGARRSRRRDGSRPRPRPRRSAAGSCRRRAAWRPRRRRRRPRRAAAGGRPSSACAPGASASARRAAVPIASPRARRSRHVRLAAPRDHGATRRCARRAWRPAPW